MNLIIMLNFRTLTKHGKQVFITLDETSLEVNCGGESVPHSHILQCDYSVSDTCMSQDHLQSSTFTCGKLVLQYCIGRLLKINT